MREAVYFGPKIVVGIDGSANATSALRWAVEEASHRQASVEAVHVWEIPSLAYSAPGYIPPDEAAMDRVGQGILDAALSTMDHGDVKVLLRSVEGTPIPVLTAAADEPDVIMLVVGARGHDGVAGLLLGSVSHALTHHCPKPLVVVPPEWSPAEKIVVGVDGSHESARALAWAIEDAAIRGAPVEAVLVWTTPSPALPLHLPLPATESSGQVDKIGARLREVVDRVDHHGVPVNTVIVTGHPARALTERSREGQMLVIGSRGLSRAHEVVTGSVSHGCTHRAVVPVVVVPHIW